MLGCLLMPPGWNFENRPKVITICFFMLGSLASQSARPSMEGLPGTCFAGHFVEVTFGGDKIATVEKAPNNVGAYDFLSELLAAAADVGVDGFVGEPAGRCGIPSKASVYNS